MRVTRAARGAAAGAAGSLTVLHTAGAPVPAEPPGKYDQVEIASENSFQKQLLGKLTQEVRAATTTGTVAALRKEVQAGTYRVDPQAIARKLLFVWEA